MVTDLFVKPLSAKVKLFNWLRERKWAKTSEIILWGATDGYSNRAARNARELAREGKIQRMSSTRKAFRFPNCREDVWEVIK